MAELTTLDKVKLRLRISHAKLDTDINDTIAAAKSEMTRAGIVKSAILETDDLILEAIKTYCLYAFASDDKAKEGYFQSWQYQLDCLRKSESYGYIAEAVT